MIKALYQIAKDGDRPFCAGLVVRDGVVAEAAPILRRFLGKRICGVHAICRDYGWAFTPVSWRVVE